MRYVVTVQFAADEQVETTLHAGEPPPPADEARRWLDEAFVAEDCEPLRPSGKLLTADKILALATAVGPRQFENADWAQAFARAVVGALGRPVVTVDLTTGAIAY